MMIRTKNTTIMKKNSNIRFLLALPAACFLLAACTGDDALPTGYNPAEGEGNAIRFTATIDGDAPGTRIQIDELDGKGRFTAGDEIGIVAISNVAYRKLAATYSNDIWTANISWDILKTASVDFHAFFPKKTVGLLESEIIEVPTDQSVPAAYTNADLLYANATGQQKSDNPVKLDFHHILARIKINLKQGSGLTDDEFAAATVVIRNVYTGYKVTSDGIISAVTDHTADIIPKESAGQSAEGRIFYAVLPPQTLPDNSEFTVTAAGRQHTYNYRMTSITELLPGNEYLFPVRLSKFGS
jgi:hypothetical protein